MPASASDSGRHSNQPHETIERSAFESLKTQEAEHGFAEMPKEAERFFGVGKAGQWKERLTRRQIRRIVKVHGVQMARFGYLNDEVRHLA